MSEDKKKNDLKKVLDHPDIKHKRDEFVGFEEVLDLIPRGRLPGKSNNPKLNEDFELLNLLENEVIRLEKLELFFNKKLKVTQDFNQITPLIDKQYNQNERARETVYELCLDKSSPMQIKLGRIFQSAFSK